MIGTDLVQRQRLGGARAVQLPVQIIQILARPVAQQHHVPHPAVHLLLLPVRLFKHGEVRERHDGARYPERDARREYHVNLVHLKLAQIGMILPSHTVLRRGVPSHENGHERDERGQYPAGEQHIGGQPPGHDNRIFERFHDRPVTIHRDAHQMEDGAGAEVHVQGVPHVAHEITEQPFAGQLHARVERHREHRDQHVGQRQRDHEIIGDDPQLPVPHHRHHHQQITEHRGHYDGAHQATFRDRHGHRQLLLARVARVPELPLLGRDAVQQGRHVHRGHHLARFAARHDRRHARRPTASFPSLLFFSSPPLGHGRGNEPTYQPGLHLPDGKRALPPVHSLVVPCSDDCHRFSLYTRWIDGSRAAPAIASSDIFSFLLRPAFTGNLENRQRERDSKLSTTINLSISDTNNSYRGKILLAF